MSKYPQSLSSALSQFEFGLQKTDLSKATIRSYVGNVKGSFKIMVENNPSILPHNLTNEDVEYLRITMRDEGYSIQTQKDYISGLKKITEFYNNHTISKMNIRWQQDTRPSVNWLTYEQAKSLMDHPKTPMQEIIVHLELCLGLRRGEVGNMCVHHIHDGHVTVIGKGQMGGKIRRVSFHPLSRMVFDRFLAYRRSLVDKARSKHNNVEVPDKLLIYESGGRLGTYENTRYTALNDRLAELSVALGFHFSHHTLRRTFARIMYHSGVKLKTIRDMLGHESIDMTLKYIGIEIDEMETAMSQYMLR